MLIYMHVNIFININVLGLASCIPYALRQPRTLGVSA